MSALRLRSQSQCFTSSTEQGLTDQEAAAAAEGYRARRDSQLHFAEAGQTVVVFDWDDTLFPTWYLADQLKLDLSKPLERQTGFPKNRMGIVRQRLSQCEARAAAALRRAKEMAHVVVVTLASSGWITMACESFYPTVGKLLNELSIPVIYAQEREQGMQQAYNKAEFQSNEELERYWGPG
eukprot:SRR837773.20394.p2 GENE.SRR837773.20394~~SRR837773.20394.p2  ORF type:complete len:198 (+),score=80.75 SRR837773.20394:54-596(+)